MTEEQLKVFQEVNVFNKDLRESLSKAIDSEAEKLIEKLRKQGLISDAEYDTSSKTIRVKVIDAIDNVKVNISISNPASE